LFISTKTYGHEVGLSCCFRQWKTDSHCKYLHGYALAVTLEFEAMMLDDRNWVVDFGGLKAIKEALADQFDHKCLVAYDDPLYKDFEQMDNWGIIQMRGVTATGCEAFAYLVGQYAQGWLKGNGYTPRVRLRSVEVREHGANSAIWRPL